jgi:hypothetical protein
MLPLVRRSRRHTGGHHNTEPELWEIVTPRTNSASLNAAEHPFAAIVGVTGVSFELAADAGSRRLYVRAADAHTAARVVAQLDAAYPQAHARRVANSADPARSAHDQQRAVVVLRLGEAEYLPLRVPLDRDIGAARATQADPLLGF